MTTWGLNSSYSSQSDHYTTIVSLLLVILFILSILLIWGLPYLSSTGLSSIYKDLSQVLTIERIR